MRRITNPADLAAYRLSFVPASHRERCQRITSRKGVAIAYIWTSERGDAMAVAWLGNSVHPWSWGARVGSVYRFKNADARRNWVAELLHRAASTAESRSARAAQRQAKRAQPHRLTVGAVLRASWGYEQTNIDYYEVTRLIGARMVEVREISQEREETGFMQGKCVPVPGEYVGEPKRCRVSDEGDAVKVSSCSRAYLVEPTTTAGGVKVYPASHWTAYA